MSKANTSKANTTGAHIVTNGEKIVTPKFPDAAVLSDDRRSTFLFEEKKCKYTAINTQGQIGVRLKIDGGLYTADDGKKCDFGLLLKDGQFFLIELKGKNIPKAYAQLLETKKKLEEDYKGYSFQFHARVVCSSGRKSTAPKATTSRQRIERAFCTCLVKGEYYEEKIDPK